MGEAIHKEGLFLHLKCLELYMNTLKCGEINYLVERKSNFIFTLD